MLWHPFETLCRAVDAQCRDFRREFWPETKWLHLDDLDPAVIVIHGSAFGAGHLGGGIGGAWKHAEAGAPIRSCSDELTAWLTRHVTLCIPAFIFMTPAHFAMTQAAAGLSRSSAVALGQIDVFGQAFAPIELFMSRHWGDPVARVRCPAEEIWLDPRNHAE